MNNTSGSDKESGPGYELAVSSRNLSVFCIYHCTQRNSREFKFVRQSTKSVQRYMMAENIGASLSSNDQNADWQTTKPTIRERNAFMFNNPLMSDVTFVVRASEKNSREIRVPAHKYVLAISSPVFYAMFYGDIAEKNNSIHLPDCHANGFHEFLRFLYSDEVKLTTDLVLEVLYLSKKYIVPHLTTKCVEYLEKELNCNNAFEILKQAKKFDEENLVDRCWEMIDIHTLDCIQSEAMLQVDHGTLESLIKRDTLNVEEVELFKAAKQWAERKCSESGVDATGPEMRRMLGDALFHFRFLEMKPEEFTKNVVPTKICLDAESLAVVVSFINGTSTETDLFPFAKDCRSGSFSNIERLGSLPLRRCARSENCKSQVSASWCKKSTLHSRLGSTSYLRNRSTSDDRPSLQYKQHVRWSHARVTRDSLAAATLTATGHVLRLKQMASTSLLRANHLLFWNCFSRLNALQNR